MNPKDSLAIQLFEDIFCNIQPSEVISDDDENIIHIQPAEVISDDDENIIHEAVLPVTFVIELLKKYAKITPDQIGWAKLLTDDKLKGHNRIRFQISNKIQAAMKEKGITQADLAKMTNKDASHINRLLSGKNMTISSIIMLQEVLEINILDLS